MRASSHERLVNLLLSLLVCMSTSGVGGLFGALTLISAYGRSFPGKAVGFIPGAGAGLAVGLLWCLLIIPLRSRRDRAGIFYYGTANGAVLGATAAIVLELFLGLQLWAYEHEIASVHPALALRGRDWPMFEILIAACGVTAGLLVGFVVGFVLSSIVALATPKMQETVEDGSRPDEDMQPAGPVQNEGSRKGEKPSERRC